MQSRIDLIFRESDLAIRLVFNALNDLGTLKALKFNIEGTRLYNAWILKLKDPKLKGFRNPGHRVPRIIPKHNECVLISRDYTDTPNKCVYLKSNDVSNKTFVHF